MSDHLDRITDGGDYLLDSIAKSAIKKLISQAMPEENYYHSGWNSAISTMRENLKRVGLL